MSKTSFKSDQHGPPKSVPPPVPLYSLERLKRTEFHQPEAVIQGVLNEGETILIVGRPKMGKSRLVAQAALSIARGVPFLCKGVPRARLVLILDLENRPAVIKDRFNRMGAGDLSGDERIFLVAPESLSETGVSLRPQDIPRLKQLLDESGADILVVDTWRLLLGAVDENRAECVLEGLRTLSVLRQGRPTLCIVLVHHLRKQHMNAPLSLREDPYTWIEAVSGHHALVGHVDACFGLDRESAQTGEGQVIVFGGVARNAASSSMILEDDTETLLFTPSDDIEVFRSLLTEKEAQFFKVAQRLHRFGYEELRRACDTKNRKTVTTMLGKALGQGIMEKTGAAYRLVASGDSGSTP